MLASSISAPSTLVQMMSAVSGRIAENPKSPRIRPGHGVPGGRAAFNATVTRIRISGGVAKTRARLRPKNARGGIEATVPLIAPIMGALSHPFLQGPRHAGLELPRDR